MSRNLFCVDDSGTTFVVNAGPSPSVLHGDTQGEMCMAAPAVAESKGRNGPCRLGHTLRLCDLDHRCGLAFRQETERHERVLLRLGPDQPVPDRGLVVATLLRTISYLAIPGEVLSRMRQCAVERRVFLVGANHVGANMNRALLDFCAIVACPVGNRRRLCDPSAADGRLFPGMLCRVRRNMLNQRRAAGTVAFEK